MIPLEAATPGDLVFCHSSGVVGRAIRIAEKVRWPGGAQFNHVAWIDRQRRDQGRLLDDSDPCKWIVGQAEARGVTDDKLLSGVAGHTGEFVIVPLPPEADREKVLRFLRAQVGSRYGFVTIFSILVTILTPQFFNVMLPNTWVCSAVAAEGLRFGGWLHQTGDIYQISPAELWEALK